MNKETLHLLLVDDENSLREPLADYLHEHYGYLVTQAKNGIEALEILAISYGQFDVALIDQVLDQGPGGLELLKHIKLDYPHIEVILFTGWGMAYGLEALQAGAFRYLAKPFNPEELGILIRHAADYHALIGTAHEKKILEQLMAISAAMLSNQNIQMILDRILKGIKAVGFDRVRLYLLSEDGQEMIGTAHMGMDEGFLSFRWKVQNDPYMQKVSLTLQPQRFIRESNHPLPFEKELSKQGVAEWLCVPLLAEGKIIGKVSADNKFSKKAILKWEIDLVTLFASQAAMALQNALQFHDTKQRAEELEILRQTSLAITSNLDQEQLLITIIQQAVQLLRARSGGIYEYDAQIGELTIITSYGYDFNILGETLRVGEGMAGKLIASGDPYLLTDDYSQWEGRVNKFSDRGLRALLEVPLQWKEKRIGILFIDDVIGRKFNAHDAALLGLFADQAALALEKARGFTRLHQIKEQLDRLIDSSFDAVIAIDTHDRIVVFNERAEALLNYQAEEMLGKNVSQLHNDIEIAQDIHQTLNEQGSIPIREVMLKDKEGNKVPVLLSATLIRDDHGQILGQAGFMRDLRHIRLLEDRLRALISVGNALNETLELRDVLNRVIEASLSAFPMAQQGAIHLYDPTADLLLLKVVNHPYVWEATEALSFRVGEGIAGWVFEHNQPVAVAHAPQDPRYKRIEHPDVPIHQSMLCVPLVVRTHVIGTLTLNNLEIPKAFTSEDLQLLSTFASQAAIAIDNARLYDKANRQADKLNTLQNLALVMSSSLDLDTTLSKACEAAVDFFNADHSGLVLFDDTFSQGWVAAEFPKNLKTLGMTIQLQGIPIEMQLIIKQAPVIITDVANERELGSVGEMMYQDFGIHSTIFVPVISNDRLLGSFSLDAIGHLRQFTAEEVELCTIFAAHVATAVENARLYQQAQQHQHLLTALDQASRTIRVEKEIPKLLHQIVVLAVELVNCEAGCLFIHDPHRKELVVSSVYGISADLVGIRLLYTEGLAGQVVQRGASELVGEYAIWPDRAQIFEPYHFEGMVGVPLKNIHTGQVDAVLIVAGKTQMITPTSLEVLERFAAQGAIALQTSQLISGEQRRYTQLSILRQISDYIQAAGDLDKILHVVLTGITAGYGLGFNRAALFLLDDRNEKLVGRLGIGYLSNQEARNDWHYHHERGMENFGHYIEILENEGLSPTPVDERIKALELSLNPHPPNLFSDVMLEGKPAVAIQDGIDSLPAPFVTAFEPALPLLVVPLTAQAKTIGVLIVDNKFTREPITEEDVKVVTTFANTAALAIEKMMLLEETRRGQENFRIFSEASNLLISNQDPEQVLQDVVEQARKASNASWVSLVLIDEFEQPIQAIGSGGDFQDDIQKIVRSDGITLDVIHSGTPYLIEDVQKSASQVNPFLLEHNIKAAICLPMALQGKRLGALWVHFETQQYFPSAKIEALQIYVNQAAIAYDAARRLRDVEIMRRAAETLALAAQRARNTAQAVAEVTTLGDLQSTLNSIAVGTRTALNCDVVTLYTYDQETDEFGFPPAMAGVQKPELVLKFGFVAKDSVPYRILALDDIHVAEATERDNILSGPFAKREGVKSSVGIPLIIGLQKVGVMFVNYRHRVHWFTDDELANIRLFSQQAAIAIHNAQLYERAEKTSKTLRGLYEAGKMVSGSLDLVELLHRIAEQAARLTGHQQNEPIRYASIHLGKNVHTKLIATYPRKELPILRARLEAEDRKPANLKQIGIVGRTILEGKPQLVRDVRNNPDYLAIHPEIHSELAVPISLNHEIIGAINVEHTKYNVFQLEDQEILELLASQAAIAIENARLYGQAQRRAEALEALNQASQAISTSLSQENTLNQIARQALHIMGIDCEAKGGFSHVAILEYHVFKFIAASSAKILNDLSQIPVIDLSDPEAKPGIAGRAAKMGITQNVGRVEADTDFITFMPQIQSQLSVPIKIGELVIGVISIEHPEPNAFSLEDEHNVESLAAQAGIALENARLFEETQFHARLLNAATQMAQGITSILDVDQLLDHSVRLISKYLGFYHTGIFLLDETREYAVLKAASSANRDKMLDRHHRLKVGQEGIVGTVTSTGKYRLTEDVSKDSAYFPNPDLPNTRAEMAFPFIVRGEIIGALDVQSTKVEHLNKNHIDTLQTIADQLAIAIRNAQLFEQKQQNFAALQHMNDELKRAEDRASRILNVAWMGTVASAWRHNIGNNVTSIEDLVKLTRKDIQQSESPEKIEKWLHEIEEITNELQKIPMYPTSIEDDVESVSINQLLEDRISQLQRKKLYEGIRVNSKFLADNTASIRASSEWLRRVIDIVTNNAIRAMTASPEKQLTISTCLKKGGIEIAFTDTGCGISPEIEPLLFNQPIKKEKGDKGNGLGLFLAQTIIQAYGGTIRLGSPSSKGTTILMWFPLEGNEKAEKSSSLPHFLLISNMEDQLWQQTLTTTLTPLGLLQICSPEDIHLIIEIFNFPLVIVNASIVKYLPDLIRKLILHQPNAKIIVATASPTWKEARESFYAGASDYIRKSQDPTEIVLAAKRALQEIDPQIIAFKEDT